ncbi:MAG: phosphate acyltransferase [Candidatus Binatota bacterium]|nr:phosphate acyltransferase [Candidatus Binatota bacterium]
MTTMRIAIDAMGSDLAPVPEILGASRMLRHFDGEICLVGPRERLEPEMARLGCDHRIDVLDAPDTVTMEERPIEAFRRKPRSSLRIGLEAVRRGDAAALVSAGNSGALLVGAVAVLGSLPGHDRPALAVELPTMGRSTILTDAGANTACRPSHLLSFARMAAAAARVLAGVDHPTVGVLGNGTEPTKGTDLTRAATELLRASELDFTGYVEPHELPRGVVDVVVTDGFTGNVLLKTMEGTAELGRALLARAVANGVLPAIALGLARFALRRRLHGLLDYRERGGAPLLGVRGLVIAAHGRSNPDAIGGAIRQAMRLSPLNLSAPDAAEERCSRRSVG